MSGNQLDNNVVDLQKNLEKSIEEMAIEMYQMVFKIAQHFIRQSKNYSIEELLTHDDPTYENIAKETKTIAKLMESLAELGGWNEERSSLNVKQAAIYMSQMAIAIVEVNEKDLKEARLHLEKITFI